MSIGFVKKTVFFNLKSGMLPSALRAHLSAEHACLHQSSLNSLSAPSMLFIADPLVNCPHHSTMPSDPHIVLLCLLAQRSEPTVHNCQWERGDKRPVHTVSCAVLEVSFLPTPSAEIFHRSTPSGVDQNTAVAMALCNDIAEEIIDDITPSPASLPPRITPAKMPPSCDAHPQPAGEMMAAAPPSDATREVVGLWTEHKASETQTLDCIGKLDKLETCVQAHKNKAMCSFHTAWFLTGLPNNPPRLSRPSRHILHGAYRAR